MIEKVLFGAGLGLAGTAAIYLYRERKREEQERQRSEVNMEIPQSKARVFPSTEMPRKDIKLEDNKKEKVEVPEEDPKKEKKGEEAGLFSWFMAEEKKNEEKKNEEKKNEEKKK